MSKTVLQGDDSAKKHAAKKHSNTCKRKESLGVLKFICPVAPQLGCPQKVVQYVYNRILKIYVQVLVFSLSTS